MNLKPLKYRIIAVLYLFLTAGPAPATETESAFDRGVVASLRGDHAAAIEYFTQALREGRQDGKLYYNLGVSYYGLGQYDPATRAFQHAADDPPLQALAYYNLALVAVAQNNNKTAEIWLQRCLGVADDDRLRTLARTLQGRLAPDTGQEAEPGLSGNAYASINTGYDDNVLLRDDTLLPSTAVQGDSFLDMFGYAGFARHGADGPQLDISAYLLRYDELRQYNLDFVRIGGTLSEHVADWDLDPGLHVASYELGGNPLYRTVTLDINGQHRLDGTSRLKLGYMLERINESDAAYTYLAGWRHRFRARAIWLMAAQRRVQLEYTLEVNDREDLDNGTTFTSYSPLRNSLRYMDSMPLGQTIRGSIELRYRDSRYRDSNVLADSSRIRREEQQYDFKAGLARSLAANIELEAEYRYTVNQSSLARYDYYRNQIHIGISMSL